MGAADLALLRYGALQTHFAIMAVGFILLFWHRGQKTSQPSWEAAVITGTDETGTERLNNTFRGMVSPVKPVTALLHGV